MSQKETLALWQASMTAFEANNLAEAMGRLEEISEIPARLIFNMAQIATRTGDLSRAHQLLTQTLVKDKHLAVAFFARGVISYKLSRFADALEDFACANDLMHQNLLIDYKQLGLKYKMGKCEVQHNRALTAQQLGQAGLARECFNDAANPDYHMFEEHRRLLTPEQVPLIEMDTSLLFTPPKNKVKGLETKKFTMSSEVRSNINAKDTSVAFQGEAIQKRREDEDRRAKLRAKGQPARPAYSTTMLKNMAKSKALRGVEDAIATHKAVYQYVPQFEGDLELEVGDLVTLKRDNEDGWYSGINQRTKLIGVFPAAYVAELPPEAKPARAPRSRRTSSSAEPGTGDQTQQKARQRHASETAVAALESASDSKQRRVSAPAKESTRLPPPSTAPPVLSPPSTSPSSPSSSRRAPPPSSAPPSRPPPSLPEDVLASRSSSSPSPAASTATSPPPPPRTEPLKSPTYEQPSGTQTAVKTTPFGSVKLKSVKSAAGAPSVKYAKPPTDKLQAVREKLEQQQQKKKTADGPGAADSKAETAAKGDEVAKPAAAAAEASGDAKPVRRSSSSSIASRAAMFGGSSGSSTSVAEGETKGGETGGEKELQRKPSTSASAGKPAISPTKPKITAVKPNLGRRSSQSAAASPLPSPTKSSPASPTKSAPSSSVTSPTSRSGSTSSIADRMRLFSQGGSAAEGAGGSAKPAAEAAAKKAASNAAAPAAAADAHKVAASKWAGVATWRVKAHMDDTRVIRLDAAAATPSLLAEQLAAKFGVDRSTIRLEFCVGQARHELKDNSSSFDMLRAQADIAGNVGKSTLWVCKA